MNWGASEALGGLRSFEEYEYAKSVLVVLYSPCMFVSSACSVRTNVFVTGYREVQMLKYVTKGCSKGRTGYKGYLMESKPTKANMRLPVPVYNQNNCDQALYEEKRL